MDRIEFAKQIKLLASAKKQKFATDDIESWYQLASMKDYPLEAWRAACVKLAFDPGDWPTFDKLAALASEHQYGVKQPWEEAYERVKAASKDACIYDKERTRAAINSLTESERHVLEGIGGFNTFWNIEASKIGILRAQFRDIWNGMTDSQRRLQNLPESVRPKLAHTEELKKLSTKMGAIE